MLILLKLQQNHCEMCRLAVEMLVTAWVGVWARMVATDFGSNHITNAKAAAVLQILTSFERGCITGDIFRMVEHVTPTTSHHPPC